MTKHVHYAIYFSIMTCLVSSDRTALLSISGYIWPDSEKTVETVFIKGANVSEKTCRVLDEIPEIKFAPVAARFGDRVLVCGGFNDTSGKCMTVFHAMSSLQVKDFYIILSLFLSPKSPIPAMSCASRVDNGLSQRQTCSMDCGVLRASNCRTIIGGSLASPLNKEALIQ